MNKFDRFQLAAEQSGVVLAVREKFGKWGEFHIDNADVCLLIATLEDVDPALLAVTWLNETSFRFYSEPNQNNDPANFDKWDVGPGQTNVGIMKANIANKFLNVKDIDIEAALGTESLLFVGDPIENLRLAARLLLRIGRGTITGPSQTVLYPTVQQEVWNGLSVDTKNERRAVAYTGPEARPSRYRSWVKFGPMFGEFFRVYQE